MSFSQSCSVYLDMLCFIQVKEKGREALRLQCFPFHRGQVQRVCRIGHQADKKVKDICGHNSWDHVVFAKRPSLLFHGHHPRPSCQILYEQLTSLGKNNWGLSRYHVDVVPRFLHDLLYPCQGQQVRPSSSSKEHSWIYSGLPHLLSVSFISKLWNILVIVLYKQQWFRGNEDINIQVIFIGECLREEATGIMLAGQPT